MVGSDGKVFTSCAPCFHILTVLKYVPFHILNSCTGVERPAVVTKMNLTLSADHRVFDGKVGGIRWSNSFYHCSKYKTFDRWWIAPNIKIISITYNYITL